MRSPGQKTNCCFEPGRPPRLQRARRPPYGPPAAALPPLPCLSAKRANTRPLPTHHDHDLAAAAPAAPITNNTAFRQGPNSPPGPRRHPLPRKHSTTADILPKARKTGRLAPWKLSAHPHLPVFVPNIHPLTTSAHPHVEMRAGASTSGPSCPHPLSLRVFPPNTHG